MRAEVDASAVYARYPDASPTERFAAAERLGIGRYRPTEKAKTLRGME